MPVQHFPNVFDHRTLKKLAFPIPQASEFPGAPSGKPQPSSFHNGGSCPEGWICHFFMMILTYIQQNTIFVFHIVKWVLYFSKSVVFPPAPLIIPWSETSALMSHSESLTRCWKTLRHQETGPGTIWSFPGGAFLEAMILGRSRRENTGFAIKCCRFKFRLNHLPAMWLGTIFFYLSPQFSNWWGLSCKGCVEGWVSFLLQKNL